MWKITHERSQLNHVISSKPAKLGVTIEVILTIAIGHMDIAILL